MNYPTPHRIVRTLLVLVFAAFGAAALAQVEVTFRQFDPPSEISALQEVVDQFNAERDDIEIRLQSIALNDALNTYVREAQAGGGPDIVQMGLAWVPSLTNAGLLVDLTALQGDQPLGAGVDDFLATELTTVDGILYAAPWTVDTITLAYRPEALEAAGLDAFPDTWEAFQAAAPDLTRDTDGDGRIDQYAFCFAGGAGLNSSIWFIGNYYLWSQGAALVEQQDGVWQVGASVEELAGAMSYFATFFEEGWTPRAQIAATTYADSQLTNGLAQGDCAVAFFGPQTFRTTAENADTQLATAKIPAGSVARISHLGGRALGINPATENPEATLEVLRYLISADTMAQLPQYPAQQSLLEAISFPEAESGFVEMLPQAVTFKLYTDSPVPLPALAEASTREYAAVFSGQKSPERAAQDLIDEIENLLNEQ